MSQILALIRPGRSECADADGVRPLGTVEAYRRFFLPAGRRLAPLLLRGCCRGPVLAPGAGVRGAVLPEAVRPAGIRSSVPASVLSSLASSVTSSYSASSASTRSAARSGSVTGG